MLSMGIIIRFIMCCKSFPNIQSFICLKNYIFSHFSVQDLSHIVTFFELWTKKSLYHHRVPRHFSLSICHRPHAELCTWSWTAPRITLVKERCVLRWSCSSGGGAECLSGPETHCCIMNEAHFVVQTALIWVCMHPLTNLEAHFVKTDPKTKKREKNSAMANINTGDVGVLFFLFF